MKLRLSLRAQADLDEIAAYLDAHDPQAAQQVASQLSAALRILLDHPRAGRSVGGDLHRFAVPRLPYVIFYRVDDRAGVVAVATIRHTARRPVV